MAPKNKGKGAKPAEVEEVKDVATVDETEEVEEADESADEEGDSVQVSFVDPNLGLTERTFSKEVHGKDFQKVAKRFCEVHKDKSAQIVK